MKLPDLAKPALWLWTIGVFLLGSFFNPFFGSLGERAAEVVVPRRNVRIEACLPLKDARVFIKQRIDGIDKIIADQAVESMNETSVFVQNVSVEAIKEAILTVYPITQSATKPSILYTNMFGSSLQGSSSYKVDRREAAFQITIPVLNPEEFGIIETKFSTPIGYIVELFADGLSAKAGFEPGCEGGSYIKSVLPSVFFEYYSSRCEKPSNGGDVSCKIDISVPLEITADMRGKNLVAEQRVVRDD